MARPHIQVILADQAVPENLRTALQRVDASASFWPLAEAVRGDPSRADALVMVVPANTAPLAGSLRAIFDRLAEHPRATLVLTPHATPNPRLEHPPTVPVSFGHAQDAEMLSVRLGTMLEMRHSLDSLHRGLLANRRSGESLARRYQAQLRLASQVQREFLPEALPRYGPVSFSVLFRPVEYVSGDIYDVRRLDEEHVGLALADASGHGIPAALLTVYIKRALRGKRIENGSYRILRPDEVLAGLNEDILEAQLAECPFVAAVYAVLNVVTLELTLARAGAPYPIHRSAAGELALVETVGGVVGVTADAGFEVHRLQLQAGESVVFHSDGVERVVSSQRSGYERQLTPLPSFAAAATLASNAHRGTAAACATLAEPIVDDPLTSSTWWATLREHGPAAALEQLAHRQRALRRMGYPLDDLTALVVQVDT